MPYLPENKKRPKWFVFISQVAYSATAIAVLTIALPVLIFLIFIFTFIAYLLLRATKNENHDKGVDPINNSSSNRIIDIAAKESGNQFRD